MWLRSDWAFFWFATQDFLSRRTGALLGGSLFLPLAFAPPALGNLPKELRVHHLMLGAGGRIQKVGRQGTGAIGTKSGTGAGDADTNSGKLMAVISKKRARRGKPETRVSKNLNPAKPPSLAFAGAAFTPPSWVIPAFVGACSTLLPW
jgi:hypothetical protein